jgi:hypothetical protein
VTDTLFPMAELAQRWAVTPNTVSRRLAFLGIKPIRQGNYRFLTSDQYELATALHDHVQKGQPMETFPRPQEGEGEATTLARRTVRSDHADPTMALVAAMAAKLTPPADPLQQARRLKEAAELAVWLSNAEWRQCWVFQLPPLRTSHTTIPHVLASRWNGTRKARESQFGGESGRKARRFQRCRLVARQVGKSVSVRRLKRSAKCSALWWSCRDCFQVDALGSVP